jgi:molybdate transport system substrate-binding protein
MKINKTSSAIAALGFTVLFTQAEPADAAELKVWTARAIATVLGEAGPQFEQATGHKITVSTGLPDQFARRAAAGESFDIIITVPPALDTFIKQGKVIAETRTNIARSGLGVEVRAGAPKPDIGSMEAERTGGGKRLDKVPHRADRRAGDQSPGYGACGKLLAMRPQHA